MTTPDPSRRLRAVSRWGAAAAALIALAAPRVARAETLEAASCSDTDVQAQVDLAVDGDTVTIPAGECTWSSGVSFQDKNVEILGAGIGATVIEHSGLGFGIRWSDPDKARWRVSGMTFHNESEATTDRTFNVDGSNANTSSYGWRIDHVSMSYAVDGGQDVMLIFGPTWGLLDHIDITKQGGTFILIADFTTEDYDTTHLGQYSHLLPTNMGSLDAIYIEDSSFTCGGASCAFLDSSSGGQRSVFRRNSGTGGFLYSHWTRSNEIDGHTYEWYENAMDGGDYGANGGYPIRIESGTGVIFDNTFSGFDSEVIVVDERRGSGIETSEPFSDCDGTREWDGNYGDTDAPGWPCLGQIGRGTGDTSGSLGAQPSVPLLVWNNGSEPGCSNGGSCSNGISVGVRDSGGTRPDSAYISSEPHTSMGEGEPGYGDVDYCEGASAPATCGTYTNTYVPLAYPHPLQGIDPGTGGGGTGGETSSPSSASAGGDLQASSGGEAGPAGPAGATGSAGDTAAVGVGGSDAEPTDESGGGCDCTTTGNGPSGSSGLWLIALAALVRRRSSSASVRREAGSR